MSSSIVYENRFQELLNKSPELVVLFEKMKQNYLNVSTSMEPIFRIGLKNFSENLGDLGLIMEKGYLKYYFNFEQFAYCFSGALENHNYKTLVDLYIDTKSSHIVPIIGTFIQKIQKAKDSLMFGVEMPKDFKEYCNVVAIFWIWYLIHVVVY